MLLQNGPGGHVKGLRLVPPWVGRAVGTKVHGPFAHRNPGEFPYLATLPEKQIDQLALQRPEQLFPMYSAALALYRR